MADVRSAVRFAIVALLVGCLASCGLFVSFDDFDTSGSSSGGDGARFVVGGNVRGLGVAKATLTLNSGTPHEVSEGRFVFPEQLLDGAR